jgi:hypothetical protein
MTRSRGQGFTEERAVGGDGMRHTREGEGHLPASLESRLVTPASRVVRAGGGSAVTAPSARDLQELLPPTGREGEQGRRRSSGWADEQRKELRGERLGKEGWKSFF